MPARPADGLRFVVNEFCRCESGPRPWPPSASLSPRPPPPPGRPGTVRSVRLESLSLAVLSALQTEVRAALRTLLGMDSMEGGWQLD